MKSLIGFGHRPLGKRLGIGVIVLAVAGVTVMASHDFSDVPDSHPFHAAVSQIVGAGITGGCDVGLYCPNDPVTRGQMAAFLTRTASRIGHSSALVSSTVTSAQGQVTVAQKTITIPGNAAAGTAQMVRVDGEFTFNGNSSGCTNGTRCTYTTRILDVTAGSSGPPAFWEVPVGGAQWQGTVSRHWAFTAPSGSTRTYAIQVLINMPGTWQMTSPSIVVATAPFGATGANTLGPDEDGGEAVAASDSTIAQ